jgi:hypothetical protein
MPRRRWTSAEIQQLAERYPVEGPVCLALEFGRSEDSVSGFARRCGLRTPRRPYLRHAAGPEAPPEKNPDAPH